MRSAVGIPSKCQIRGLELGVSQRLAAGDVERSAVLVRMRARDGISQMPPLGSKRPDTAALELISGWVLDELPGRGNEMRSGTGIPVRVQGDVLQHGAQTHGVGLRTE